jgi:NAD(P)-dependent dehydrogenase (short-subunit alcohol dehydrogenase family)
MHDQKQELWNKVALVTGAGRGMGAVIARTLAARGASVAVCDVDGAAAKAVTAELDDSFPVKAFQYDVTRWDETQRVVAEIEAAFGRIDILVNNAGVSRFVSFLEIDEAEWDRVVDINLKGVFLTCRAVLPGMIKRRYGRVVNMGSILSKMGEAQFSHYSASKFGVLGLTQAIASEVAQHDVTANTVCPGIVYTPLWQDLFKEAVGSTKEFRDEAAIRAAIDRMIPLGRPQPPEDVAEMVAYLASDRARNMTGGSYHVDGGRVMR